MEYQLVSVEEAVEYGLQTPDGTVIWPPQDYRGFAIDTAADRAELPTVLRVCAGELLLDPESFAAGFGWVPRAVMTTVVAKVLDGRLSIDEFVGRDVDGADSTPE